MSFDPTLLKVALLSGGTSGEREISLASGNGAREALNTAGFKVVDIDPADREDLKRLIDERFDVAFLCLHGRGGEDGTMQGMLDLLGIPYTGSGVLSSAVSMNKSKAKVFYESVGLPTPPSIAVCAGEEFDFETVKGTVGYPCVAKPASEGSALGVVIANDVEDLQGAVESALRIDDTVVIERYVSGTEVTVAVLGNENPYALPVIGIVPVNAFYDFESKYAEGGSRHICPAPLDELLYAEVQSLAVEAHKVLGCRGMSRSDFIIDESGSPWILETNTIPGMTGTSLLPDAARVAGMEFPDLCTELIRLALK